MILRHNDCPGAGCERCRMYDSGERGDDWWSAIGGRDFRVLSRPLRVVHVGPAMMRGGVERHALALAENFDPARAIMTSLIITSSDFDRSVAEEFPCPVVQGGAEQIRNAARNCDVMLHWGGFEASWLDGCKPPVVIYMAHGEGDWTGRVLEGAKPVTDHCIAVSRRARQTVQGFPTTTIPNGVDPRTIAPTRVCKKVRDSLGFSNGDFVSLFLGRFSEEKRPEQVIRGVAMLPENHKVLLVGWGKMESELRTLAAELLPGRHAFATTRRNVGDYLNASDCIVIPSDREGGPLVLLEAMFTALPVVTTNVGLVPEMSEHGELFRIVDGTTEDIAAAIEDVRCDLTNRIRTKTEAAKHYAWNNCLATTMADRYCDVFERLYRRAAKPKVNLGVPP